MDMCLFVCMLSRELLLDEVYSQSVSRCRYGPNLRPLTQKKFGMTEQRIKGSKYKNGHISAITYGTMLGVVPMDRYLFGAYEKV